MSEFIQKPSEPANNNVAWGFPGCDALSDDSLRIKFGDFEVQPMDNDKVIVYLDDLVFVDGVLVEGLPVSLLCLLTTTTTPFHFLQPPPLWRTNQPTRNNNCKRVSKVSRVGESAQGDQLEWNDRLAAKEQECQRPRRRKMNMTHLLRENSQTLDIVTSELNNAKTKMTSLLEDNQQLKIEMTSLQITADKTEYDLQIL
ncbi:hypothetical protein BSL78_15268 [Apostichopus japonicus]|uniref:Uncharacterized protein n=1 Tax=Stichopus japonicus TaxID=307972 RepID=A0A2G8KIR7_STIJA|nr:hypothetical protein BSL78_15268 [Apostichopus japonicus]